MNHFNPGDRLICVKTISDVSSVFDLEKDVVYVVKEVRPSGAVVLHGKGPGSYKADRFQKADPKEFLTTDSIEI